VTIKAAAFDADGIATAKVRDFATSRSALLSRTPSDFVACPGRSFGLRMPMTVDAETNGPAVNIGVFDTCSVYPAAPLDVAGGFTVDVARIARNFGLAHETADVRKHFRVTPYGELLVSLGCRDTSGRALAKDAPPTKVLASFPLPDPATAPTRMTFSATLPRMTGDHDLCFQFTSPAEGPNYAPLSVQLTERR
jgi:hexosaminidase